MEVLDVGTMPGHLVLAIKFLGCKVAGTDKDFADQKLYKIHSDESHAIMRNKLTRDVIPIKELNIETEPLPFADNPFDGVTFTETIEYFTHVTIIRCLILFFNNLDLNLYKRIDVPNTSAFELRFPERNKIFLSMYSKKK